MKNLLNNLDLEYLEELPYGVLKLQITKSDRTRDGYRSRKSDYHKVYGVWPYERIERILEKYVGQHVDDAFSEYCKHVPKYQQKFFLSYVENRHESYRVNFVDGNGIIRRKKEKKRKYTYSSIDLVIKWRHKVTGVMRDRYYWYDSSDYERVIVSGVYLEFESRTPEYKRLQAEKRKLQNKNYKTREQKIRELGDELLHYVEKSRKEKERLENEVKIVAHGFDLETSFRP